MREQLLDATTAGIAGLDVDGCCQYLNPAGREMLERGEEVVGADFHSMAHVHPAGQAKPCNFWTACQAALHAHQPLRGQVAFRRANGEPLRVRYWLRPLPAGGGALTFVPLGMSGAQRERRFKAMIEHSADAIALISAEGRFLYNSEAGLLRILGYHARELLGRDALALVHRDDVSYVRGVFQQLLQRPRGTIQGVSYRCRRQDGNWRWLEATGANLLEAPAVRAVVVNYRDVTDRRAVEEALERELRERRRLQEQLQQAQKMEAVGRLAGGVAHDFNNLLTVISGYSELMLAREAEGPNRAAAEQIQQAALRAARLTRQLLAFSRRQVLAPQVVDLNIAVANMGAMLRRVIGEDIQLVVQPAADLGLVRADPGQIEQVVLNLALNARDAMPKGGRLIFETGNITLDEAYARQTPEVAPGDYAMLAVTDSGIGMDAATKARIFEPFFTTKEAKGTQAGGSGLGLATAYGIVKQSGGHITVYSEPGHGATFRIYLPRLMAQEKVQAGPPAPPPPQAHAQRILLVEDEPGVRDLVREILAARGYRVQAAGSPREAMQQMAERIDLLVTDVILPGMNGRELADLIRAQQAETRVLFMSGYTDRGAVQNGLLEDGVEFIQKPFSPVTLVAKVAEILG
ncbi:MAG: PAS domain S-box protein [Terriglobales bacterium]